MADVPENPTRISGEGGWTPLAVERLQEVLPAYEVIELLGAGGMGAVYKARQKSLKRLVAIKILPTAGADDEFKFVERFRNEAETLAQMNHPAIVGVYDFGETPNGLLYFVMEFVDGTDVHKMIQTSGKLSTEHALSITAHVCDALSYAHRMGVIHRDIKPANILINREGHVKVADFGLAKMHNAEQVRGLTMSNMAMGTPDYAAPEVFKDVATVDHRADLYAVGVMLYQMLTGEVPRGFFRLPSEKGVDPRFDAIIVKAMEASRDDRYQSALEVRHALDEILTTPLAKNEGTGVISARSLPPRTQATPRPQVSQATPAPSGKAKRLGAAAIVAVLGIAAVFALGGKKQPAVKTQTPATPAQSVAKPQPTPTTTLPGRTVDLLPLVDVPRDVIAGPTIDWLKADVWKAPWVREGGAVKATANDATTWLAKMEDGTIRVRFRMTGGDTRNAPPLQIAVRATPLAGTTKNARYLFQFLPQKRTCHLLHLEKGESAGTEVAEHLWRDKPFLPTPAGSNEFEFEVRAERDQLSVWSGGQAIASARDARVSSGSCGIIANPGIEITILETVGVGADKTSVASPPSSAASDGWQPIFTKREDFGGDLRNVEFRDGATFLKSRSYLAPATPSGGAIRATLRYFGTDRTGSLALRSTENVPYGEEDFACIAFLSPSGGVVMKVRDRTTGSPGMKRHDFTLAPALKPEETFVFELRATDGKITVSVNGREVGSVPDMWKGGARRFGITPSNTEMTEFRDVAVRVGR